MKEEAKKISVFLTGDKQSEMFSWFSHLAIETNSQTNKNTWLEPVDNNQYAEATKEIEA